MSSSRIRSAPLSLVVQVPTLRLSSSCICSVPIVFVSVLMSNCRVISVTPVGVLLFSRGYDLIILVVLLCVFSPQTARSTFGTKTPGNASRHSTSARPLYLPLPSTTQVRRVPSHRQTLITEVACGFTCRLTIVV